MDQNYFEYDGWSFIRNTDESLTIQRSQGSDVFNENKPMSIQIPKEDVYRLISYSLTGSLNNEQVTTTVKELATKHQLVGSQSS